jgi:hypothetical protein
VFIPEYVVGHWWENLLHNQSALRLKGRLLFQNNVMVTSVPWQLDSSQDRADDNGGVLPPSRAMPADARRAAPDRPPARRAASGDLPASRR